MACLQLWAGEQDLLLHFSLLQKKKGGMCIKSIISMVRAEKQQEVS